MTRSIDAGRLRRLDVARPDLEAVFLELTGRTFGPAEAA